MLAKDIRNLNQNHNSINPYMNATNTYINGYYLIKYIYIYKIIFMINFHFHYLIGFSCLSWFIYYKIPIYI